MCVEGYFGGLKKKQLEQRGAGGGGDQVESPKGREGNGGG